MFIIRKLTALRVVYQLYSYLPLLSNCVSYLLDSRLICLWPLKKPEANHFAHIHITKIRETQPRRLHNQQT